MRSEAEGAIRQGEQRSGAKHTQPEVEEGNSLTHMDAPEGSAHRPIKSRWRVQGPRGGASAVPGWADIPSVGSWDKRPHQLPVGDVESAEQTQQEGPRGRRVATDGHPQLSAAQQTKLSELAA